MPCVRAEKTDCGCERAISERVVNSSTQDWTLSLIQEWIKEVEPIGGQRTRAPSETILMSMSLNRWFAFSTYSGFTNSVVLDALGWYP